MIQANADGAVNLFYDGGATPKLATTSTGVDITGTVVSDGLSVDGGTIKLDGNYPNGGNNVALGDAAGDALTTGGDLNTFVGSNAGSAVTTGDSNSAFGAYAFDAGTGSYNTAVGSGSLGNASNEANSNTAVGYDSLTNTVTGGLNVAVGLQAGNNIGLTLTAGSFVTGINYTIQTTGTTDFTLIGAADSNPGTTFTATGAGTGTGTASSNATYNTLIGYRSGDLISGGSKNTILGRFDGNQGSIDIRNSNNNIVLSDGDGNPRLAYVSANTELVINEQSADVDFRVKSDGNNAALFVDAGDNRVGILNSSPDFALDVGPTSAAGNDGIQINATRNATLRFLGNDASMQADEVTGRIEWYTSDTNNPGVHAQILTRATNTLASGEMQIWSGTAGTIKKNVHFRGDQTVFNPDGGNLNFTVTSDNKTGMFFVDAASDQVVITGGGSVSGPSNYRFISYADGTAGRSVFTHAAGDGGVVISGSAGGSQAALIMGNNWSTDGSAFSEEWRILMDGSDDSLNFQYNGGTDAFSMSNAGKATFIRSVTAPSLLSTYYSGDTSSYDSGGALRHCMYHYYIAAPAQQQYRKIAELPPSSGVTGEKLKIRVFISALQESDYYEYNIVMGQRNNFAAMLFNAQGTSNSYKSIAGIKCYEQTDGSTDVYMYTVSGAGYYYGFTAECWADGFAQTATLIQTDDVTNSSSVPSGTLVFDSTNDTYHKPRFYVAEGINESNTGSQDINFRHKSESDGNLLYADGDGNGFVAVGTNNPSYNSKFNVSSGTNTVAGSFESALGGAGAACHVYLGVSTRSSNGLRLSSNGSSASINGGALAANVVNTENASLYLGANNAIKAELDTAGRFAAYGIGYSLQSIGEPSSQLAAKITSASSVSYDCVLDSSTGDWSGGYVYIKASTVNSNQASPAAAWWFYRIMHYNGGLSSPVLVDSGGNTGNFTITISDQGGTDPITVRVNIAHSNNRLTTMIDVGNYYGIASIT